MSEIHPKLEELVEELSEETGMPKQAVVGTVEAQTGVDLADVEGEHAEEFVEAFHELDEEKLGNILREYDVEEDAIEAFQQQIAQRKSGNGGSSGGSSTDSATRENGESPPSGGGDGLSRKDVEEMVDQRMDGLADEIASKLGGGGGGGQPAANAGDGGGGGLDPGTQQILAQALSQHFLGGGGGQMAELGQQVQKEAMQNFIQDLRKPDFGDLLEAKFYEEALDSDMADDMMADLIPSKEGSSDEKTDPFESLMVEQPDVLDQLEAGELTAEEARELAEDGDSADDDGASTSRWGL